MKQKGNSKILLIVVIVVVLIVGWYLWRQGKTAYQPSSTSQSQTTDIQSGQDLQAVAADLDSTDIDSSLDQELNQNDQDAAIF